MNATHKRMIKSRASLGSIGSTGVLSVILVAGLCVGVAGCKTQQKRPKPASNDEPVNSTLSQFEEDGAGLSLPDSDELMEREGYGTVHDQIAESARQLNVYFANMEIDGIEPAAQPEPVTTQVDPVAVQEPEADSAASVDEPESSVYNPDPDDGTVHVSLLSSSGSQESGAGEDVQASLHDGSTEAVQVSSDPLVRKEELASELTMILRDLASTSDDPGSAALALASLETMLPSDVGTLVEDGVLSDAERTSLDAVRSFLGSLSTEGSIASPSEVSAQLEEIKRGLDAWAGLSIKKAALCTRVDGFGRYDTFSSYRFVAGRAQPVIVYVELERFAQREISGPDGQPRYETKLSQRLELYHVADDLNTWNRAAEPVGDESRNRLRDYYLINQVTLPATLGVGRYHLKVVMRDLIGERVAETIIPIEIVAR